MDDGYHYTSYQPDDDCCPIYEKDGCIIDGVVYHVGQNVTKTDKKGCTTIKCVEEDGTIKKMEEFEKCRADCPLVGIP